MPDAEPTTGDDETGGIAEPAVSEAVRLTESYKVRDGVVFYDAENPLAWLQADHAVDLDEAA